jgi:hypothetical protein
MKKFKFAKLTILKFWKYCTGTYKKKNVKKRSSNKRKQKIQKNFTFEIPSTGNRRPTKERN